MEWEWNGKKKIVYVHPYFGEMIQFDYLIFFKGVETTS